MIYGIILAALVGLFLLSRKDSKKAGKKEAQIDTMKESLDDTYTAKLARDRLAADPEYAKRVRDKYTRK